MVLLALSCQNNQTPKTEPLEVKVRVRTVEKRPYAEPVRSSGVLATRKESLLSFKTGGIIDEIPVKEGAMVDQGQLLARLKMDEIDSRVRQARLAYEKARRDFSRAENLYRDSVATLEQYQDVRTLLQVRKSDYEIAVFNQEYSEVRAPARGKILKKLQEENEMVRAGMPLFLFGSLDNDWIVRLNVTDADFIRLNPSDSASLQFDAYNGQSFSGRVTELVSAADPYTGTYEVEVLLDDTPGKLAPGFVARAEIYPATRDSFLFLPVEAIIEGSEEKGMVYVARDSIAERHEVTIHRITDQGVYLRDGLQPGDPVIIEGGEYIKRNSTIRIVQ